MKTAISINDATYKKIDMTAARMGISRSRFFALAAEEYIQNHRDANITAALNAYYDKHKSNADKELKASAYKLFAGEDW